MIRKANLNDIDSILGLYREQFSHMHAIMPNLFREGDQSSEFIRQTIEGDKSDILVLDQDGKAVGFVLLMEKERAGLPFFVYKRFCYLMDIVVTEHLRSSGGGAQLMEAAKAWAAARDLAYIELDVLAGNGRAHKFYEKQGFSDMRRVMHYPLDGYWE